MPFVPGGRNVSLSGYFRHVVDGESNGAVQDRIPGRAALDEGCISGTGSRYSKTDGEIPQGLSVTQYSRETQRSNKLAFFTADTLTCHSRKHRCN